VASFPTWLGNPVIPHPLLNTLLSFWSAAKNPFLLHPLSPPLLIKERGKKKERGAGAPLKHPEISYSLS